MIKQNSFVRRKNVVPGGGFEPPTRGFSVLCSCTYLRRHIKDLTKIILPLSHLRHTEDVKWRHLEREMDFGKFK